jgi:hypothetical protein
LQVNGTAYILFANPNEKGVPVGNWTNTYDSRDDLAQAIRTGVYRERRRASHSIGRSGAGGPRVG